MKASKQLRRWDVTGKKQISLTEYTLGQLADSDVHLEFLANGICGSDVHMFATGAVHSGHSGCHQPLTLGHELVARVLAVGSQVSNYAVGDIVAVEPGLPCNQCNNCKAGRYHCCPKTRYMGTPPQNGGLADEFHWPARWCHKLPQGLTTNLPLATLVEPLAACRQGWKLRNQVNVVFSTEEWTAIAGGGAMAFGTLAIIKATNPQEKVLVLARSADDLAFAKEMGADAVLQLSQVNPGKLADEVVGELSELFATDHHDASPVEESDEAKGSPAKQAALKAAREAAGKARERGCHASEIATEVRKAALEAANRVLVAENTAVCKQAQTLTGGMITSLFECTGNERLLETIIASQFLLGGGCIIGVGCHYGVHFDVAHLRRLELTFQPVRRSCDQFAPTIELLERHPALFQKLIGHTCTFEEFGGVLNGVNQGAPTGTNGPKTVVVKTSAAAPSAS